MSPEVAAKIFKATLLSSDLLEITAKTSGRPSRTYKFEAPADYYLHSGETPASLKGQPIVLYQDESGALAPVPYYYSDADAAPAEEPLGFSGSSAKGANGPAKGPNKSNWKKTLRTLDKYEADRDKERKQGKKGLYAPPKKDTGNGIECPTCFLEAKDGPSATIRCTYIPTIEIICSCGYSGRRTL